MRDREILRAAREVHRRLGKRRPLEEYEYELTEELRMRGIGIRKTQRTQILFGNRRVGVYLSDLILDGQTLIEIKRADHLTPEEKEAFGAFINEVRYRRPPMTWKSSSSRRSDAAGGRRPQLSGDVGFMYGSSRNRRERREHRGRPEPRGETTATAILTQRRQDAKDDEDKRPETGVTTGQQQYIEQLRSYCF